MLCSNQEVTNKAIDLLKETFTNLGPRQVEIHEDFIGSCIDRLKASFDTVSVLQTESGAARDQGRIQTALQRLCQVVRVLHEYVSECDGDFQEERTLLPLHRVARGKKDLPRSFLDRFSKVFMAALSPGDLGLICSSLYPCHHNWRTSATPWAAPPPSSPICTAWRRPGGQETPAPQVSYPHPSPLLTLAVPSTGVRPLSAELHRLPPLSAHPLLLPRPHDARGGGAGQARDCGPPVQGHVTEQPREDDLALPGLQPGLPGGPRARLCQDPGRHCCLAATATGTATSLLPNFVATPHPQVTDLLQSCPGVTRGSNLLLALKVALLSLALGPRTPSGEVVRPVMQYLLSAWREEEQEREERKEQEEAMHRTRTLPGEEESEQERKDYDMVFPSFSELFADLVQEEQFKGKEEKEQEQEVSKDSAPINDAYSLLQRLFLHAAPSEQQCREVQHFYRHPNPAEAVTVVPLLAAVSARVIVLLDQFPENPLLEQVLKVKARVLALPAGAPLPQLLIGLEQKNAHRGVSLQDQMDQLTQLILRRRKL